MEEIQPEINLKHGKIVSVNKSGAMKILSEKTGTLYRQSMPHEWYVKYYHDKKKKVNCSLCGKEVYNMSLVRHYNSDYCKKHSIKSDLSDDNIVSELLGEKIELEKMD